MRIKNINGIDFLVDKRVEFIFAIHSVFLKLEKENNLDWVEAPEISYVDELTKLINIKSYPKLIEYIKYGFDDYSTVASLGFVFDNDFNIINEKITPALKESFVFGNIYEFAETIKKVASEVNWNIFFESKKTFFSNTLEKMVKPADTFDIDGLDKYYTNEKKSYKCMITTLINGGFSIVNGEDIYCICGLRFDNKNKCFIPWNDYSFEILFHEYLHPAINPLVDKYISKFNIMEILNEGITNGLPECYSDPKVFLYEYLVRANARILASKYQKIELDFEWEQSIGFIYLPELTEYIKNNMKYYLTFEEFFKQKIIDYINSLNKEKIIEKL